MQIQLIILTNFISEDYDICYHNIHRDRELRKKILIAVFKLR